MRIYSYILKYDTGFAPCIENSLLTLATCKPLIRSSAKIGDIIIAFYSKNEKNYNYAMAYIAVITEKMDFKEYYNKFKNRRDCIYNDKLEQIPNIYHNCMHVNTDLNGKYVLLSNDFIFFGNKNVKISEIYTDMIPKRNHLSEQNNKFIDRFPKYFLELKKKYGLDNSGRHIHDNNIMVLNC